MSKLNNQVLVLNKGWTPIGTVSLQRAIIMLFSTYEDGQPKAKVIDPTSYAQFTWDDWSKLTPSMDDETIKAANIVLRCPEVIFLTHYDKLPKPKAHFSRRALYKRDGYQCQYCLARPGSESLSLDHVLPRSQGGQTTWENVVCACTSCNAKKADKSLAASGLKLHTVPKKPKLSTFRTEIFKPIKSWANFVSELYWNVNIGEGEDA